MPYSKRFALLKEHDYLYVCPVRLNTESGDFDSLASPVAAFPVGIVCFTKQGEGTNEGDTITFYGGKASFTVDCVLLDGVNSQPPWDDADCSIQAIVSDFLNADPNAGPA